MSNAYKKGTRYYWIGKATLTCVFLSRSFLPKSGVLGLLTKKPKKAHHYHRVEIVVVRTAREEKRLDEALARRRARFVKKIKAKYAS